MSKKPESIQILFQKRNAKKRGPTSSYDYNDNIEELAHDLSVFHNEWNNGIVPLTNTLPSFQNEGQPNSFRDGLDGTNLYVVADSSPIVLEEYYNTENSRPNTIHEQFELLTAEIEDSVSSLQSQITTSTVNAAQVPIVDTGSYFNATNVENALQEAMLQVNNIFNSMNTTNISSGVGDPEGVVTAPVGSLYVRTSGTDKFYVKRTGSGNTGWDLVA